MDTWLDRHVSTVLPGDRGHDDVELALVEIARRAANLRLGDPGRSARDG